MTKAELLADIVAEGGIVISTEEVEDIPAAKIKRYITNVFTKGEDQTDATPIAQKRNINWYTVSEGEAEEAAYYGDNRFKNPEDKNPTGSTLDIINGIFRNSSLKNRVMGVICKNVRAVLGGTPSDNDKALCKACLQNPDQMATAFMQYVASNGTIQANGGAATDSDLEYVVITEAWDKIATAIAS